MSARGEADENPGARNLSRTSAGARLDAAPFRVAGGGARGAFCRDQRALPASHDALRPGGDRAGLDDGGTANHPRGADAAKRSGRRVRGTGGFRACGETGRRRIGRGRSRRPGARSSGASAGGDFVVCGSMVPGSAAAEFADGRRTVPGREDAVLGWVRPVVLLPAKALTGLSEEQIAMIIAHELAHIRRLDGFVNLFQIGVETLLFYHPAVWWVSQRIRTEREHCCDDEAVAVSGDAVNYARALTLMEEWRTAPSLLMAANRSPLSERVVRLLGLDEAAGRLRVAGMAVAVVGLAGAMLAGNAFLGVAHAALGSKASANRHQAGSNLANLAAPEEQSSSTVIVVRPANTSTAAKSFASTEQAGKDKDNDKLKEKKQERDEEQASGKESYLEGMEAAGFKSLTADELIAMKIQGVTPAYVKEIH